MKILVLGAGVIGMTTAYALARQGHEVIVLDRETAPARVTSHANGAQLAYSYVEPFASPAALKNLFGYMVGKDPGIHMRPALNFAYYKWGLSFLRHCTTAKEQAALHAMLSLATESSAAMDTLSKELPQNIIYGASSGKIILTRSQSELDNYDRLASIKHKYGLSIRPLNKKQCIEIEPSLTEWGTNFQGGMYSQDDHVLDPTVFCAALHKASIEKFTVSYKFNHEILGLIRKGGAVTGVHTNHGEFFGDAVIVCLGNEVNSLLKPLKETQNIYPLQGYSLTLPLGATPPTTSITDPKSKLVFSNLGDSIRIAGLLDTNLPPARIPARGAYLLSVAQKLWPDAADYSAPNTLWSGQRPATPSGIPIVQASRHKGLYFNIGHGSLGLTLAAGCAERIARMLSHSL